MTPFTLALGTYNRLGIKTYLLFLYEAVSVPFAFALLGLGLIYVRQYVSPEMIPLLRLASLACFGLFFVGLIIGALVSWIIYVNHGFCLTDDALKIKKGIFTRRENSIPYRQIQSIDIERDLGHQLLGLSRLVVFTAGHDDPKTVRNESVGILPIVDKDIAMALQDELLKRTDVQKVTYEHQ